MEFKTLKAGLQAKNGAGQEGLDGTTPRKEVFGPADVQEHLRQKGEAAKADFERFGFEARGEVDNLPALEDGEKRVLDHVLDKELAAAYDEAKQASLKERKLVILKLDDPSLQRRLERSLKEYLKRYALQVGKWEDASCLGKLMEMPHVPTHPALERYLVGKDDPLQRTGLIGELGVKAMQAIKADEVLGFYAGYYCSDTAHKLRATSPPPAWREAREAAGDSEVALKAEWKNLQEKYAVDLKHDDKLKGEHPLCKVLGSEPPIVNAFRYGNILCLVNDPSQVQPYVPADGNVTIHEVLINNFLFGIMATTKHIDKNEDLRYSYGSGYWNLLHTCDEAIENARKQDALQREKDAFEIRAKAAEARLRQIEEREKLQLQMQAVSNPSMLQDASEQVFQPSAASTSVPFNEEQRSHGREESVAHVPLRLSQADEGEDGEGNGEVAPEEPDVPSHMAKRQKLMPPVKTTCVGTASRIDAVRTPLSRTASAMDKSREAPPRGRSANRLEHVVPRHRSPTPVTEVEWTEEHEWYEKMFPLLSEGPCFTLPDPLPLDPRYELIPGSLIDELAALYLEQDKQKNGREKQGQRTASAKAAPAVPPSGDPPGLGPASPSDGPAVNPSPSLGVSGELPPLPAGPPPPLPGKQVDAAPSHVPFDGISSGPPPWAGRAGFSQPQQHMMPGQWPSANLPGGNRLPEQFGTGYPGMQGQRIPTDPRLAPSGAPAMQSSHYSQPPLHGSASYPQSGSYGSSGIHTNSFSQLPVPPVPGNQQHVHGRHYPQQPGHPHLRQTSSHPPPHYSGGGRQDAVADRRGHESAGSFRPPGDAPDHQMRDSSRGRDASRGRRGYHGGYQGPLSPRGRSSSRGRSVGSPNSMLSPRQAAESCNLGGRRDTGGQDPASKWTGSRGGPQRQAGPGAPSQMQVDQQGRPISRGRESYSKAGPAAQPQAHQESGTLQSPPQPGQAPEPPRLLTQRNSRNQNLPEIIPLAKPGSGFKSKAATDMGFRPAAGRGLPRPSARPDGELLKGFRSSAPDMGRGRPQHPAQQQPPGRPQEGGVGPAGSAAAVEASGSDPGGSAALQEQRPGPEGVPPSQG